MENIQFQNYNYLDDGCLDIVLAADFDSEITDQYKCPLVHVVCRDGDILDFILCNEGTETKHQFSQYEIKSIEKYVENKFLLFNAEWEKCK